MNKAQELEFIHIEMIEMNILLKHTECDDQLEQMQTYITKLDDRRIFLLVGDDWSGEAVPSPLVIEEKMEQHKLDLMAEWDDGIPF